MWLNFCDDNSILHFFYYSSYAPVTQMPHLPPRKICSRCGFSKEESESFCERCRNGQEPYLTYVRTSSRCAKCGGVTNDVEQTCEYCRNAQELPSRQYYYMNTPWLVSTQQWQDSSSTKKIQDPFLLLGLDELCSDANMTLRRIDLKPKSTIPQRKWTLNNSILIEFATSSPLPCFRLVYIIGIHFVLY